MDLIFGAIVPGWKGKPLPRALPRHVVLALHLSLAVLDLLSLLRHGRTFSLLTADARVAVLQRMTRHRWAWQRHLVRWWKLLALVTR